jgi:hypothetical protein
VPPANTLVRRVGKCAFAAIVPARPCPVFGRPVHQWGSPLDYGPVLLRKPFRFHLTVDTLPSGCLSTAHRLRSHLGCFRCFQLRARLGPSLSVHPGQRGITPAFGYGAPYPGASGTSTHLIWALPSTQYGPLRHPIAPHPTVTGPRLAVTTDHAIGLPVLRALSLCTCCCHYPGAAPRRRLRSSHPDVSAFPERVVGSACTTTFSRLARHSLALRPAHSRCHLFVTRFPKASAISSPP